MSNPRYGISIPFFLLLFILCVTGSALAQSVGSLTQVSGNVRIGNHQASAGTTLAAGDVISTTTGPAVISLGNGQTLTVSANSQVQIQVVNGQYTVTTLRGSYSLAGTANTVVQLAQSSAAGGQGCTQSPKAPGLIKKDPPCPPGQAKKP